MYFDPIEGSEQSGRRPAVIVSGNLLNEYLQMVIVCPLTTRVKGYKGNVVLYPEANNGLENASEILSFQIRSVSKNRLRRKIGHINPQQLQELKDGLDDILRY